MIHHQSYTFCRQLHFKSLFFEYSFHQKKGYHGYPFVKLSTQNWGGPVQPPFKWAKILTKTVTSSFIWILIKILFYPFFSGLLSGKKHTFCTLSFSVMVEDHKLIISRFIKAMKVSLCEAQASSLPPTVISLGSIRVITSISTNILCVLVGS